MSFLPMFAIVAAAYACVNAHIISINHERGTAAARVADCLRRLLHQHVRGALCRLQGADPVRLLERAVASLSGHDHLVLRADLRDPVRGRSDDPRRGAVRTGRACGDGARTFSGEPVGRSAQADQRRLDRRVLGADRHDRGAVRLACLSVRADSESGLSADRAAGAAHSRAMIGSAARPGARPMIRLHYHPFSTYARRVLITLLEKGLQHEAVLIDMAARQHRGTEYLALNPYGRVPTLEEDGLVLYESSAIMQYLEATHPQPALTPPDAKGRALVDMQIGRAHV